MTPLGSTGASIRMPTSEPTRLAISTRRACKRIALPRLLPWYVNARHLSTLIRTTRRVWDRIRVSVQVPPHPHRPHQKETAVIAANIHLERRRISMLRRSPKFLRNGIWSDGMPITSRKPSRLRLNTRNFDSVLARSLMDGEARMVVNWWSIQQMTTIHAPTSTRNLIWRRGRFRSPMIPQSHNGGRKL